MRAAKICSYQNMVIFKKKPTKFTLREDQLQKYCRHLNFARQKLF